MVIEGALLRVVVVDAVEQVAVEVLPLLETEGAAEYARIDVAGHEGGLDENGAGAAEGVNQVAVKIPARELDESGGQHFVDGGLDAAGAVAAQVQALAAGVEREGAVGVGYVDVQTDVGVGNADVGAFSGGFAEIVDNGVLYFVCYEFRMAELL